jgi:tetratricopeptide (TPR) repeat protein
MIYIKKKAMNYIWPRHCPALPTLTRARAIMILLYFYKKIIPVFLKHNDIYRTGNTYENVAIAYQNKKKYPEAVNNMRLAEKYYQQLNSRIDMAYAYTGLGDIYKETGDLGQAILNYKKASVLAAQTSEKNLQQSVLLGLSDVYVKMNDYKNAYWLLDSSYKIKDSLFTKEKQNELLKLQTEFETERINC